MTSQTIHSIHSNSRHAPHKANAYDVIIIGAGAAGMMCASTAGQRGLRVLIIDHAEKLAEKIRISGGGRCNFTNLHASASNYISDNPHFCKSALSRYTAQDFLALVKSYRIPYHEKHKGQLFCDNSAEDIIAMLKSECDKGNVQWKMPCSVSEVAYRDNQYHVHTTQGIVVAPNLVVATGGLSIPKIGASDFAYRIAKQFSLRMVEPKPALVPLTFDAASWQVFTPLAGIALEVDIQTGTSKNKMRFREDLLFTHRGLSGPAVLQISSYWVGMDAHQAIQINLLPDIDMTTALFDAKQSSKKNLSNTLCQYLPNRLAEGWLQAYGINGEAKIAEVADKTLRSLAEKIHAWQIVPSGTEGYKKAEVTRGGIDTQALNQQSMMCKTQQGLYFIGESVDVTGWLGGYNFQWAWASGVAAGNHVLASVVR